MKNTRSFLSRFYNWFTRSWFYIFLLTLNLFIYLTHIIVYFISGPMIIVVLGLATTKRSVSLSANPTEGLRLPEKKIRK